MSTLSSLLHTLQRGTIEDEEFSCDLTGTARKPYLPPFLFLSLGIWLGIYLTYPLARSMDTSTCMVGAGICLLVVAALLLIYLKVTQRYMIVVALGVVIGMLCGLVQALYMHDTTSKLVQNDERVYVCEVVEDMQAAEFGKSCVVSCTTKEGRSIKVRAYLSDPDLEVSLGDVFHATTTLKSTADASHGGFWEQGIVATASIKSIEKTARTDVKGALLTFRTHALSLFDQYEGPGVAFLKAILFGDRTGLQEEGDFYSQIKVVGLAHIVAVSGAHLVVVTTLFGSILSALRLPRKVVVVVQGAFVLMYLVCAGIPLSAVRAACMTLVSMFAIFAKRASSGLNALGICLCLLLVLSPTAGLSASLLLSAGATLGILLFSRLLQQWAKPFFKKKSVLVESLSLTLSSGVFTTFICAALFSQVSLISPLSNLLFLPFFAFFCGGGLALVMTALLLPPIGSALLDALVICAQAFSEAVALVARIPFAAIPASLDIAWALLLSVAFGCSLWVIWPRFSLKTLLVLLGLGLIVTAVLLLPNFLNRDPEVIMLDVGQGDAFVIRSDASTLLIDTGNQDALLLAALARHGIYSLDAVLITHGDSDHCGSLTALQGVIQVREVLVANDTLSCTCTSCSELLESAGYLVGANNLTTLKAGDSIMIGQFELEIVWPKKFEDEGGNADSLTGILHADMNKDGSSEWDMLFCGDLEAEQLEMLITKDKLHDVDVLKVGHHGSRVSLSEEVMQEIRPEIALISAGANNRYGHPTPEVMQLLENVSCAVFQTAEQGDVVCRVHPDTLEVTTLR